MPATAAATAVLRTTTPCRACGTRGGACNRNGPPRRIAGLCQGCHIRNVRRTRLEALRDVRSEALEDVREERERIELGLVPFDELEASARILAIRIRNGDARRPCADSHAPHQSIYVPSLQQLAAECSALYHAAMKRIYGDGDEGDEVKRTRIMEADNHERPLS